MNLAVVEDEKMQNPSVIDIFSYLFFLNSVVTLSWFLSNFSDFKFFILNKQIFNSTTIIQIWSMIINNTIELLNYKRKIFF